METDPYGSSSDIHLAVLGPLGLPLWGVAILIFILFAISGVFWYGIHHLHDPEEGDSKNSENATARLGLWIVSLVFGICGVAIALTAPLRLSTWSPLWWIVLLVGSAIAVAGGAILVDVFSRGHAKAHISRLWPGIGRVVSTLLFPVVSPLEALVRRISTHLSRLDDSGSSPDDDAVFETGVLEEDEEQLGDYIAEFRGTDVEEVMTSRMDISAIPSTSTLQDAVDIIGACGHSRLPLFRGHLDHIEGIVYAKDLLPLLAAGDPGMRPDWPKIARQPLLVSTGQSIEDVLRAFKLGTTHIALIVDEYGGTEGLITLEDVLEELVGDIRDEFDQDEPTLYERVDDNKIRFDARIDLNAFKAVIGLYLDAEIATELETEQFEFETLGGLVQHLTESIPDSGIEVQASGIVFRVEDVEQHRIGHIVVSLASGDEDQKQGQEIDLG